MQYLSSHASTGHQTVKKAGGLHSFINRNAPIITDSGGFQVFSLAYGTVKDELKSKGQKKTDNNVLKITEEGVLFRSYRDGKKYCSLPKAQCRHKKIWALILLSHLMNCLLITSINKALKESLERTHRWEKRSLDTHLANPNNQAMYAVIHGGIDQELRKKSCEYLTSLPFDGFAIGGSLGKTREQMFAYACVYDAANCPLINQIIYWALAI